MEDDEMYISDFDNPQVIDDLEPYVRRYASSFSDIIDELKSNKAVRVTRIRELLRTLFNEVIPQFDQNKNLPDDIQKLEDLIARIGSQL